MKRTILVAGALALSHHGAAAMDLRLPLGATLTSESTKDFASYALPISGWQQHGFDSIWAEGLKMQRTWRVDASNMTTLQLLDTLRQQLTEAGFDIAFECDAPECGGFDFRYATEIAPEPAMHVDLGNFRFLSAQRMNDGSPEYVSLVVSRSSTKGFIQVIHVGDSEQSVTPVTTSTKSISNGTVAPSGNLQDILENKGAFVLSDLEFTTGSSNLSGEEFASLAELSDYLKANPDKRVTLVGHTDSEGSLNGNIALSKRRATSVATLLRNKHGVSRSQISAEGMGFLAPLASNLTEEGRTKNRRVEVILTSTQ